MNSSRLGLTGIAAVTIAAAVGGGSAAAQANPAPTAHKAAACQGDDLSVSRNLDDGNQAGMNHDGSFLVVTNSSLQTCTIKGYLSLQLLDSKHQALHTTTDRGPTYFAADPGAHIVTLRPGQRASADLAYVNGGVGPARAVNPTYLQITTPGAKDGSFTIPFSATDGIYQGALGTTALTAGAGSTN